MKKIFFLLISLLMVQGLTAQPSGQPCQSCLPEGIKFLNQSQIDSFPIKYPNCTSIEGWVQIRGDNISNLNGLNVLLSIGGYLDIKFTDSLCSFTGLDNLNTIGGSLTILSCMRFHNLSGFESLSSIGDSLILWNNDSLISLSGLENLAYIGSSLEIHDHDRLTSLAGLEELDSIGSHLSIYGNTALASLTALYELRSIGGGELFISTNSSLSSLAGLDNIEAGSISDLVMVNNPVLSSCAIHSICDYLTNPNGNVAIFNNSSGCNNTQEIEDSCAVNSVENMKSEVSLTIYPNPGCCDIYIDNPGENFIFIYNNFGQQIRTPVISRMNTKTIVDVSTLKNGIYLVRINGEKGVQVAKFVKE